MDFLMLQNPSLPVEMWYFESQSASTLSVTPVLPTVLPRWWLITTHVCKPSLSVLVHACCYDRELWQKHLGESIYLAYNSRSQAATVGRSNRLEPEVTSYLQGQEQRRKEALHIANLQLALHLYTVLGLLPGEWYLPLLEWIFPHQLI